MTTRCQHTGSSCIHRTFPQQAYRVGPERATLADVAEIVVGTLTLIVLFAALAYGPWLLAGPR
jgi:hypothetical protein